MVNQGLAQFSEIEAIINTLNLKAEQKQLLIQQLAVWEEGVKSEAEKSKKGLPAQAINVATDANLASFKEKLVANIGHELRTPLNAILGMTHLLKNTELNERQQEFLSIINTGAQNLQTIIDDLLELSLLSSDKITIQNKPFSLDKLLSDLFNVVWFRASQKNIELKFFEDEALPDYLLGDYNRMYQILMNLLNNGIKFTAAGSVSLQTRVLRQNKDEATLSFVIKDTGIGIAPEKLPYIFETFTKAYEEDGRVYPGTGSGLTIVKKLVGMMNGDISVESNRNQGSKITVTMTFLIPDKRTVQVFLDQKVSETIRGWDGKKILYIEDNDANILYLENILSGEPVEFDIAKDLSQASTLVATKQYDCILTDVKLPDGNGIDFIEQLRSQRVAINKDTLVIVITAGATDSERRQTQEIGIEGYIQKPFSPDVLFDTLNRLLSKQDQMVTLSAFPLRKNKVAEVEDAPISNTSQKQKHPYLAHLHKVMKGNKQAMVEMLDIFLKQLPDSTRKMEVAVLGEDWQRVHFEAHKVKSTIGIMGIDQLHELILEINDLTSERRSLSRIPNLFAEFKYEAQLAYEKCTKERGKLAKSLKKRRKK